LNIVPSKFQISTWWWCGNDLVGNMSKTLCIAAHNVNSCWHDPSFLSPLPVTIS